MNILMMTNTYTPYTGGVQRSIDSFTEIFRKLGHRVLIIAPEADMAEVEDQADVFRVSSIKNFNDTNFPVTIPLPGELSSRIEEFEPDIVHSHFPFIIGSAAMRVAAGYNIPLVFTYHTMYERYIHYVNAESERVKAFVKKLTAGYANLCDLVIAPGGAVKDALVARGVESPVEVIPTGIDAEKFRHGNREQFREKYNIPQNANVVGHLGRLAEEKNLMFLVDSIARFLKRNKDAYFVIVGNGPLEDGVRDFFTENALSPQVVQVGVLLGSDVVDAYHAMDVFTFSSKTETQGMVLAEAMATGLPVVALRATGVTDILQDGVNGYMSEKEDPEFFSRKIEEFFDLPASERKKMKLKAQDTAKLFSIDVCALRVLEVYEKLIRERGVSSEKEDMYWHSVMEVIKAEWDIFHNYLSAVGNLIIDDHSKQE
jgi:1,2-diacylglycerol 3-alpha-glucosyltransferase